MMNQEQPERRAQGPRAAIPSPAMRLGDPYNWLGSRTGAASAKVKMHCFWKDLGEVDKPGEYHAGVVGPIQVTLSDITHAASMEGNILCALGSRPRFGPTGMVLPGTRERWVIETMTEVPDDYELPTAGVES